MVGRASQTGTSDNFGVFRYKPGGALDKSWSGNGKAFTDFGSGNDTARDVAIQENGKIVVAGDGQIELDASVRGRSIPRQLASAGRTGMTWGQGPAEIGPSAV